MSASCAHKRKDLARILTVLGEQLHKEEMPNMARQIHRYRYPATRPTRPSSSLCATRKTHPLYKKQYTVNTKFMAHDEKNEAKVGDKVMIIETRPLSARKRFTLDKIVERAGARFEETDAMADVPARKKPRPKAGKPKAEDEAKDRLSRSRRRPKETKPK